ncbi:MAG: GSCFA domain-containing protein [Flavobacteriales bacterium]|nr:GSCFA domain-containing protein [Flavobacteriia bacterium]NCP05787.1 GSCFA domain-containing protein [Flavobacteriales bacterium]PIV94475.1 MAG: GSCFA domain-containing protein [Flavobacteriaceae bacterium CG17_big_fil_post_rev_8_21_14_2_50_33_15]PIY11287.1 MAG: GSCFA domain-containing protein [Flavobacteriaceae bacterium CG_4_10_14_3_um_filter_33_47]PJB20640.1 MAG: GSCFA domain-containing protein [Flavobacteriaceae bacterium CG_4_9_14_3_um_filter_33_16]
MNLIIKIPILKANSPINYSSKIVLLGSCFSDNIGEKLEYYKFQNLQNPLGILFHPKAIETLIVNAIEEKSYLERDLFFYNEQWHCFDAHSKLSNSSKEVLLSHLNQAIESTNQQISKSTHIIITLGTAWAYRFVENNHIVANCHKVPQKQFSKELLSVEEILQSLENMVSLIQKVNPDVAIIFTVSPVRHIKDGFVENTQSKAHLISAIHRVLSPRAQSRGLYYFPSYEIMMDELRDYRFYAEDMIHPNQIAINYIWEKFQEVWMSSEVSKTMEAIDEVQKGLNHKPFNPNSKAHKAFLQNLEAKKRQLQIQFPHIQL